MLTRKKFNKVFQLIKLEDLYNFTESFIGYGYYNRISMSQKKTEIIKLAEIVRELQPKVILEIGTRKGGTLFMWSRISEAKKIISIDLPAGPFGGGYAFQKRKLYKYFVNDTSTEMHLIQADSHSEISFNRVKKILQSHKIDLLFIDGDHSYEGVKKDYVLYSPFVKKGGMIVFHDIVQNTTLHHEADKIAVPKLFFLCWCTS